MTTTQAITRGIQELPEAAQREVLDFVEFLRGKARRTSVRSENAGWEDFSLACAMRGMEDDETAYSPSDLRERFR